MFSSVLGAMKYRALLVLVFSIVSGQTQDSWGRHEMTPSQRSTWGRWEPWWPRPTSYHDPWYPRSEWRRRTRVWREPSRDKHPSNSSHHHHDDHHYENWPNFIAVPVPIPVPQYPRFSNPSIQSSPSRPLFPANLGSFGLGSGSSTTSTSSLLPPGPISATVTLTGPGGVPIRATTTSSNGVFSIPSLAQLQTSAGSSPAAQAAAQVVAAAQAAYNAQTAYQLQASEAARAATQAAYAQQAAAVARNAANTVSSSLGSLGTLDQTLQPLPPF